MVNAQRVVQNQRSNTNQKRPVTAKAKQRETYYSKLGVTMTFNNHDLERVKILQGRLHMHEESVSD